MAIGTLLNIFEQIHATATKNQSQSQQNEFFSSIGAT